MRYKGGWAVGGEGKSGKQGWCRLLSHGTPEPRSPLRAGPAIPVSPPRVARARKCMKTSTHSPSPTSAKLHDLRVLSAPKLFPANRKNSPSSPANPLSSSTPQGSLGFLHRYIFSVNAPRGSLFQPHREYTESLIKYVNVTPSSFTGEFRIRCWTKQIERIDKMILFFYLKIEIYIK